VSEKEIEKTSKVKEYFTKKKKKYGYRRISMDLGMNHKTVQRIMQNEGLVAKVRCSNPYKKMKAFEKAEHVEHKNILNREFEQNTPYKFLSADITYLFCNGFLGYLFVVKDIATGEVLAFNVSKNIDMELVTIGLKRLLKRLQSLDHVLIHTDQGVHFTAKEFVNWLKDKDMVQSMSRKGMCIDNAPIESFFGHLKDEMEYSKCKTLY
jgi:transposase InsO family protein